MKHLDIETRDSHLRPECGRWQSLIDQLVTEYKRANSQVEETARKIAVISRRVETLRDLKQTLSAQVTSSPRGRGKAAAARSLIMGVGEAVARQRRLEKVEQELAERRGKLRELHNSHNIAVRTQTDKKRLAIQENQRAAAAGCRTVLGI
jgi:prefoldin subunit 5